MPANKPNNFDVLIACAAQQAPSADNSQPFCVSKSNNSMVLRYDADRVAGNTFAANSQPSFIAAGAALENMLQVADSAEIQSSYTCDLEHTASTNHYFSVNFETLPNTAPQVTDHPVFIRHTNRFSYKSSPRPADLLAKISSFTEGHSRIAIFSDLTPKQAIGDLVRNAGEIRFQTKEVHEFLGKSLRFTKGGGQSEDGLELATLDLPPGGGAFLRFISSWKRMNVLNKFGVYKLLSRLDAKPVVKAPTLLAFIAPDTPQGAFDAGRCMEKAWIELNSNGVACHPYYVIADQLNRLKEGSVPVDLIAQAKSVENRARELFNIGDGETLMILLRVGYPKKIAPRSGRLPINNVYSVTESASSV